MLCGNDDVCKPDRHILRFLSENLEKDVNEQEAQMVMVNCILILNETYPKLKVRALDYLIWQMMSSKSLIGQSR